MAAIKKLLRKKLISPIQEFFTDSRAVGITLLACTFVSLLLSNSAAGERYIGFWQTDIHLSDTLQLPHSLVHWINDLAMAAFFFLVGMEIKRELLTGELSSFRKAILPLAAALGGMLVPAVIYTLFNGGTEYAHGWGIPMATDIAFSLGVASLLGSRVPVSLKIFLMALAIIDDLGAIMVIALFYGGDINWFYLGLAGGICLLAALLNYFHKMKGVLLIITGLLLWYCIFNSGVHATIAGVLLALFVPVSKLDGYVHKLHDPVNFFILPVFALANTAMLIPGNLGAALTTSLSWGIMLGLLLGKPIGITLFSWLVVTLKWGERPSGSTWAQLFGFGVLAGIGFTMSIFITMLAFDNPLYHDISRIAIMLASLASIGAGTTLLLLTGRSKKKTA